MDSALRAMNANQLPREAADQVHEALEASCDALITLESLLRREVEDQDDIEQGMSQAIQALRQAVVSLRSVICADESAPAKGFVLKTASDGE